MALPPLTPTDVFRSQYGLGQYGYGFGEGFARDYWGNDLGQQFAQAQVPTTTFRAPDVVHTPDFVEQGPAFRSPPVERQLIDNFVPPISEEQRGGADFFNLPSIYDRPGNEQQQQQQSSGKSQDRFESTPVPTPDYEPEVDIRPVDVRTSREPSSQREQRSGGGRQQQSSGGIEEGEEEAGGGGFVTPDTGGMFDAGILDNYQHGGRADTQDISFAHAAQRARTQARNAAGLNPNYPAYTGGTPDALTQARLQRMGYSGNTTGDIAASMFRGQV